jgi:hypothetical protein
MIYMDKFNLNKQLQKYKNIKMIFDNMWGCNPHPHGPKQMQNWRPRKKKSKNQLLTRGFNPHTQQ